MSEISHAVQRIYGGELHWWAAELPPTEEGKERRLTVLHNSHWMNDAQCRVFANAFINMVPVASIFKTEADLDSMPEYIEQVISAITTPT